MKKWILAVVLLLLCAAGYYAWSERAALMTRMAASQLTEDRTVFDGAKMDDGTPLDEATGLAIKGLSLFQGNEGIELWRIRASWAHLSQEGENISVDRPVGRYALGDASSADPEADAIDVTADKGKITDKQRHLALWDNVIIRRMEDTITTPRIEFDAATRIMTFPQGAVIECREASGTAALLSWDLGKNEIVGSGGVSVLIKPRPEKNGPDNADASGGDTASGDEAGDAPASSPETGKNAIPGTGSDAAKDASGGSNAAPAAATGPDAAAPKATGPAAAGAHAAAGPAATANTASVREAAGRPAAETAAEPTRSTT